MASTSIAFYFMVLSSALKKRSGDITDWISKQYYMVKAIWTPKEEELKKKYLVEFVWDRKYKTIPDEKNEYQRIDYYRHSTKGSPKTLELIKTSGWSNVNFKPHIPVFVCWSAWNELNEPGEPRSGLLEGFTATKRGNPWFKGERAILLFLSTAAPLTLAHELSHWAGFIHKDVDPENIGALGGVTKVEEEQLRKLYRWASEVEYRKSR
jgi:hypothetical protein